MNRLEKLASDRRKQSFGVYSVATATQPEKKQKKHGSTVPEPDPIPNDLPNVWDLVIEDMQARDIMGLQKYQTHLQPFNGRDPLWDAYQEALDLVVYLRQAIFEKDYQKEKDNGGRQT